MPVMLGAIVIAARYLVRRWLEILTSNATLLAGVLATLILLCVEFAVVRYAHGLTIGDYIALRDPVSGAAYGISIVLFALMPLVIYRRA